MSTNRSIALGDCLQRCQYLGIPTTRHLLIAHVATQEVCLYERLAAPLRLCGVNGYLLKKVFRCSTSRFGIGQAEGSNCTPLGLHRIAEKIGGGWPAGTVFKSRRMTGFTWQGQPDAKITTRILWLDGLEPGFNRGGGVDSHARYIYIHGTGDETTLGRPASCGCIHLAADDLVPLYDFIPAGTLVWISQR